MSARAPTPPIKPMATMAAYVDCGPANLEAPAPPALAPIPVRHAALADRMRPLRVMTPAQWRGSSPALFAHLAAVEQRGARQSVWAGGAFVIPQVGHAGGTYY
jgi:hypothetical protein